MRQLTPEDYHRVARAYRNKPAPERPAPPPPTKRAESSDPCAHCGVNGIYGCEHQLPYERRDGPPLRPIQRGPCPGVNLYARQIFKQGN